MEELLYKVRCIEEYEEVEIEAKNYTIFDPLYSIRKDIIYKVIQSDDIISNVKAISFVLKGFNPHSMDENLECYFFPPKDTFSQHFISLGKIREERIDKILND